MEAVSAEGYIFSSRGLGVPLPGMTRLIYIWKIPKGDYILSRTIPGCVCRISVLKTGGTCGIDE